MYSILQRTYIFLLVIISVANVSAQDENFNISKVNVSCNGECDFARRKIAEISDLRISKKLFDEVIKEILISDNVDSIHYNQDDNGTIEVKIELEKRLLKTSITSKDTKFLEEATKMLTRFEGSYVKDVGTKEIKNQLLQLLNSNGYYQANAYAEIIYENDEPTLNLNYEVGNLSFIESMDFSSDSFILTYPLNIKLNNLIGSVYLEQNLLTILNAYRDTLISLGFINASYDLNFTRQKIQGRIWVTPIIRFNAGKRFVFGFYGNKRFSKFELLGVVKDVIVKYKVDESKSYFESSIVDFYRKNGFYETNVKTDIINGIGEDLGSIYYFFTVQEGHKVFIKNLYFEGATESNQSKLKKILGQKGSDAIKKDFLDEEFIEDFRFEIEKYYLTQGHALIKVEKPIISNTEIESKVDVVYKIFEGPLFIVDTIQLSGVNDLEKQQILSFLKNKVGGPFDPMSIDSDIEKIENYFKRTGYLYAKIQTGDESKVVSFDDTNSKAKIFYDVNLGPKLKLNNVVLIGNNITKRKAILREIDFEKGSVITSEKIEAVKTNITSMGLFSDVTVEPLPSTESDEVDLLVKLKERNFGSVEFSPGYRSDIGAKLLGQISYANLGGMGRVAKFKSELNYRLNNEGLDESFRTDGTNRRDGDRLIEHETQADFTEPHVFNTNFESFSSIAQSFKRFHTVDAHITRLNSELSRSFFDKLSLSTLYQLENIRQVNSTKAQDNGKFRIGSITPGLSLDLRDSSVVTRRGAYFKLSYEYASPELLSQKNSYPAINYYKVTSRNFFYLPIFDHTIFTGVSLGKLQNLATNKLYNSDGSAQLTDNGEQKTEGHVPSIKVFRLGGANSQVRGFSDSEINRLVSSSDDIADNLIQDSSYFFNLTIEPRYQVNDQWMVGAFYDTGRVFQTEIDIQKMRSSVGLSIRYLTSVGSIDFHYGYKLDRRPEYGETAGRFHFTIGSF